MKHKYDIFLSYRRVGGQAVALLFKERLERSGYSVFYDKESMHSGQWTEQIQEALEGCSDFLLVLSQGALDRCISERELSTLESGDVMRRELAFAIQNERNIIPLLHEFKFPKQNELPEDIQTLPSYQGVEVSISHFNETFSQLEALLTVKPSMVRYLRTIRWGVAALLVAVLGAIAAFAERWIHPKTYPATRKEIQLVNEVIATVARQTTAYESAAAAQLALVARARRSVEVDNPSVYETEVPSFHHAMREAKDILANAKSSEAQLSSLRNSPIGVDVLQTLFDMAIANVDDAGCNLPVHLAFWTRRDNPMTKADKLDCIDRKKADIELSSRLYALGIMELFLPIRWEATEEFRKLVPTFVSIPRLSGDWPRTKETLEREQSLALEQLEVSLRAVTALTGDMNRNLAQETRDFQALLVSSGASEEKAAELSGKIGVISAGKTELAELKGRLAQKKEEVYRKFRPVAEDNPGILWGKMLRFRSQKMNDAALESLEILEKKPSPDFPLDAIKAMKALVRLGDAAPFAAGVMVSGYEPPATSHEIFKVGDIIVARDEIPIRTFADFKAQIGSRYRFWRLDADGAFKRLEAVLPAAQPRVGLLEINETDL